VVYLKPTILLAKDNEEKEYPQSKWHRERSGLRRSPI